MALGTPDEVASLRAQIWDAGWRPVAVYNAKDGVKDSGKNPVGDEWQLLARRDPPFSVVAKARIDSLNSGILADGLRAVDIDIDDPAIVAQIKAKVFDVLGGDPPIRYRDNNPRITMVYRAAEGEPPKRVLKSGIGKVEILGKGQHFVAYGVHYTGADLRWMSEGPSERLLSDVPAVTEDQITALFAAIAPIIGASIEAQTGNGNGIASPKGLAADGLQVGIALSSIPNTGPADWEAWNRVGMAAWAATGGSEAGRGFFHGWSEQHEAYDHAATNARWDHYRTSPPTKIGAGTLFHMAKQAMPPQDEPPPYEEDSWRDEAGAEYQQADEPRSAPHTAPLPLEWFDDIRPSMDVLDFVQGTLVEQSSAVIYGESNSGKTFFATDLALHVAAGIEWNGKRVEQGGVVYCVLEGGQGFRNRITAWRAAHDSLETPVYFAAVPASINLLNPDASTEDLIATIKFAAAKIGIPVKLVVIDTLARALAGGNENSPEDMGALVMNMDRIRAETSAMVLFIHHSGKDAAKGARGHSSLRAAIDTEIEVIATDGDPTRSATVVKQRELPKGDVHPFSLEVVELGTNRHGEPVTTCLVKYGDSAAPIAAIKVKGHAARAMGALHDIMATSGQEGYAGTPTACKSVPEDWWRQRFYDQAGSDGDDNGKQDTRRKAFNRARDDLAQSRIIGVNKGRIWIVAWEN